MSFLLLVSTLVALALLSRQLRRYDGLLAMLSAVAIAVVSGLRSGGFDLEEYAWAVDTVQAMPDADYTEKLLVAKDPLFLALIEIAEKLGQHLTFMMLILAAIAVLSKWYASSILKGYRTLFLAAYGVLLAPGLEFAAVRAAAAIGISLLLLTELRSRYWRFAWLGASIGFHASALIPGVLMLVASRAARLHPIVVVSACAAGSFAVWQVIQGFVRMETLTDNPGTAFALALPLATLVGVTVPCTYALEKCRDVRGTAVDVAQFVTLGCIGVALGMALPAVTVSFRVLEIGWVFAMFTAFILLKQKTTSMELVTLRSIAFSSLLVLLVVANIYRDTWGVLLRV